jgi:DNA-binding NarL/FixJ family response regulator
MHRALHPTSSAPQLVTAGTQPEAVLYVDPQRLTRECVAGQLARHLPDRLVEPVASLNIVEGDPDPKKFGVCIINKHSTHIADVKLVDQLSSLVATAPNLALVLFSDLDDADEVAQAFKHGIRGYIPTSLPIQQAVEVIRLVSAGGSFIPPSILAASTHIEPSPPSLDVKYLCSTAIFSPRQLDVLKSLWQGKQNKLIAHDLQMCESTVKVHLRHIMKKLHASNRTQVVLLTRSMYGATSAESPRAN